GLPQNLSAPRINRFEPAIERSVKDHAARRRQRTTPDRVRLLDSPDFLSCRCIPGDEFTAITPGSTLLWGVAADEWSARDVGDGTRLKIHAEIVRRDV